MELVAAVRDADLVSVRTIVADPDWDVNARVRVPGTRISVYESHALFEASRSGSVDILRALLSRADLDVNQPAAAVNITALADACNRGAEAVASVLLDDQRTDPFAGSDEVDIALEYACRGGHLAIVELFAKAGHIKLEHEQTLCDQATARGHRRVTKYIAEHLLSLRAMDDITPAERVSKVWQEFQRVDEDNNGHIDISELRTLAVALGTPLTESELAEARVALDTDGNGKVDFEEFIAFWLSDEGGIDPDVVAMAARVQASGAVGRVADIPGSVDDAEDADEWGAAAVSASANASPAGGAPGSGAASVASLPAAEGTGSAVRGTGVPTDYA